MVTLRSSKDPQRWVGGALLFSGRPDPVWEVGAGVVSELEKIWEYLGPWSGPLPQPPVLGYRGCFLSGDGQRKFFAFGGAVTLKNIPAGLSRRDDARRFERVLLSSAPAGMVPSAVLETEWGQ
jgi:hypothetical protein